VATGGKEMAVLWHLGDVPGGLFRFRIDVVLGNCSEKSFDWQNRYCSSQQASCPQQKIHKGSTKSFL
jgi:hypothetical protein